MPILQASEIYGFVYPAAGCLFGHQMCHMRFQASLLPASLFRGHGMGSTEHLPYGATLDIQEHRPSGHQVFKAGCQTVCLAVSTGNSTASTEWGIHSSAAMKCHPTDTPGTC